MALGDEVAVLSRQGDDEKPGGQQAEQGCGGGDECRAGRSAGVAAGPAQGQMEVLDSALIWHVFPGLRGYAELLPAGVGCHVVLLSLGVVGFTHLSLTVGG